MKFSGQQKHTLIAASIWVLCLLAIFPILTNALGTLWGYATAMAIYWGGLCWMAGQSLWVESIRASLFQKPQKLDWITFLLAAFPVATVLFVAFLPRAANYSLVVFPLALIFALINGVIEELYWRGCCLNTFSDHWGKAAVFSVGLFTCWHFALVFAKGMEYEGGAFSLIAGAAVMGAVWTVLALRTQSLWPSTISHVVMNFFAFTGLIQTNFLA